MKALKTPPDNQNLKSRLDPIVNTDLIAHADDAIASWDPIGTETGLVCLLRCDTCTKLHDDLVGDGSISNTSLRIDVRKLGA
jgi:hypothetical protein